jgi:transcriptional regulator GlxA family with amidase domain
VLSGVFPVDRNQCHPVVDDLPQAIHLPARLSHAAGHPAGVRHARVVREHGADTRWGSVLNDPAISKVLCTMHNSPGEPWTVERLGTVADLSQFRIARRFTELVGRPPLGHLTWVRMNAAAERLRKTDEPLSAVAQQVGYTSEFAFSSAFRREFGIAPSGYRRQAATAAP